MYYSLQFFHMNKSKTVIQISMFSTLNINKNFTRSTRFANVGIKPTLPLLPPRKYLRAKRTRNEQTKFIVRENRRQLNSQVTNQVEGLPLQSVRNQIGLHRKGSRENAAAVDFRERWMVHGHKIKPKSLCCNNSGRAPLYPILRRSKRELLTY